MPATDLGRNRIRKGRVGSGSFDSYLAGGAAILIEPETVRYSATRAAFVDPREAADAVPHFGRPGGVLPRVMTGSDRSPEA